MHFEVSRPMPAHPSTCSRRAAILHFHPSFRNKRIFFWGWGERNQDPTKIQGARELSSGHELTSSPLEVGISGDVSVRLQQLPCPSWPLFLFSCCLNTRKKRRGCGPQSASPLPATEVNDLIPCDFSHLLQHYACVIPAISSQIKMQSCSIAGPLGGKVRGCDPRGDGQTTALLEGDRRDGNSCTQAGAWPHPGAMCHITPGGIGSAPPGALQKWQFLTLAGLRYFLRRREHDGPH